MVVELNKSVSSFESSPEFDSYESVRLDVDDDTSYFYPPNEVVGRTLVVFCPWGTQAMAQDIYNNIVGYRYQPYRADGAVRERRWLLQPGHELRLVLLQLQRR